MYTKKERLYEGKAKIIYATNDAGVVIAEFKDSATAFNGEKKGTIDKKGYYNSQISAMIFRHLQQMGVATHFVEVISDNEMAMKKLRMFPIEVVVRNIVAGSLAKRYNQPEGKVLPRALVEYYLKDDALNDPMMNADHIQLFELAQKSEIDAIYSLALKINAIMKNLFKSVGIELVDFKLEFGADNEGNIVLGDEISPDNCRLWDSSTGKKLDKDRFRFNLGNVEEAYEEIFNRLKKHGI